MIGHVVLLKPRPDLSPDERLALVRAFRRAITEIPTVRGVRIARRVTHGAGYESGAPDSADVMVIVEFDDLAGLQTYLLHPAHADLGAAFANAVGAADRPIRGSAFVYDFEWPEGNNREEAMEILEALVR